MDRLIAAALALIVMPFACISMIWVAGFLADGFGARRLPDGVVVGLFVAFCVLVVILDLRDNRRAGR